MEARRPRLIVAVLCACAWLAGGCGLLKTTTELPGRMLGTGKPSTALDPSVMQARFMRFADIFANEITRATREFAERTGTPEGDIQALTWRIDYTNVLWRLASGQRPYASLFDAIVVITFLGQIHEDKWLPQWGEADRAILDSLKRMEEGVWGLAGEGLSKEQVRQVREIIDRWMAQDPTKQIVEVTKLPGFDALAGGQQGGGGNSVVSDLTDLMSIDPLSGLEPAVRQLEQTRQFAERAFYYMQRMPELLSGRVELMVLRAGQSPHVQGTLASVERVSQAATSLAATAEALPASFAAEREATLQQISATLTEQRAGLVHDLETARAPLVELLEKTSGTAEAGKEMSDSLTRTLEALDAFVGRFAKKPGEPGAEAEPAPGADPAASTAAAEDAPPARPFDINDYGAAAERIGVAARELGNTVATLDRSLPEVQRVLDEATARGEQTIDHAFARAFQLLGAALAGVTVAVLLVRWASPRRRG